MKKIIIAAISKNWVIGRDGSIPWHSKLELEHFRTTTMNFPVIMGRKTYDSIGKPLEGRLNIIISRSDKTIPFFDEIEIYNNLDCAFEECKKRNFEKVFIIGGSEIYSQAMSSADEIILSILRLEIQGDTYFPKIESNVWRLSYWEILDEFDICMYIRK